MTSLAGGTGVTFSWRWHVGFEGDLECFTRGVCHPSVDVSHATEASGQREPATVHLCLQIDQSGTVDRLPPVFDYLVGVDRIEAFDDGDETCLGVRVDVGKLTGRTEQGLGLVGGETSINPRLIRVWSLVLDLCHRDDVPGVRWCHSGHITQQVCRRRIPERAVALPIGETGNESGHEHFQCLNAVGDFADFGSQLISGQILQSRCGDLVENRSQLAEVSLSISRTYVRSRTDSRGL